MNYFQEDFTEDNYKKLIKIAKNNYTFKQFHEFDTDGSIILWRHDVDLSIHRALSLAKIEKEEGVTSTYFLLFNSEFYNIFEVDIREKIKEILSLGHSVGLHFDPRDYNISNQDELEYYLNFEKNILETLFDIKITVFSFHNPTPEFFKYDNLKLAGMINTYAKIFKEKFGYCSDSNGYWRHDRLEDVLSKNLDKKLQVLTHPGWWQEEVMSPRQRIQTCIDGRAKFIGKSYDAHIERHQRVNVL